MRKASLAKTELALKAGFVTFAVLLLALIVVFGFMIFGVSRDESSYVVIAGDKYTVDLAVTGAEKARGLGGKTSLEANTGMLFVYSEPSSECYWMKDMQFSIDIIWLDSDGTVLDVEKSVSPDTYPKDFCPSTAADYVLEVSAGTAEKTRISPGNQIYIKII